MTIENPITDTRWYLPSPSPGWPESTPCECSGPISSITRGFSGRRPCKKSLSPNVCGRECWHELRPLAAGKNHGGLMDPQSGSSSEPTRELSSHGHRHHPKRAMETILHATLCRSVVGYAGDVLGSIYGGREAVVGARMTKPSNVIVSCAPWHQRTLYRWEREFSRHPGSGIPCSRHPCRFPHLREFFLFSKHSSRVADPRTPR